MTILEKLASAAGIYKVRKLIDIGKGIKDRTGFHEVNILGMIRPVHIKDFKKAYDKLSKHETLHEIECEDDVLMCVDMLEYGHYNKCYAFLSNCAFDAFDLYELLAGEGRLK